MRLAHNREGITDGLGTVTAVDPDGGGIGNLCVCVDLHSSFVSNPFWKEEKGELLLLYFSKYNTFLREPS